MLNDLNMDETRIETGPLSQFDTSALTLEQSRSLFRIWSDLRGDRPAPFRAEVDANRIGAAAPCLAIVESVGAFNYRVRLSGDRLNRWFGMELRGMSALAMVSPAGRNHLLAVLNRVTAEPAVAVIHGTARRPDGLSCKFEMTLLPMRSDFGRVDRVLVGMWLIDAEPLTGGPFTLDGTRFLAATVVSDESSQTEPARPEAGVDTAATTENPSASPDQPAKPLASIEGGGGGDKVRRGHLRLIKNG